MSENYPLGGTLRFTPDDEADLSFTPAPITKADALRIAMDLCEASTPEREALLGVVGPVMAKRSLRMLAKAAHKVNDAESAAYALDLREQITTHPNAEAVAS